MGVDHHLYICLFMEIMQQVGNILASILVVGPKTILEYSLNPLKKREWFGQFCGWKEDGQQDNKHHCTLIIDLIFFNTI